MTEIDTNAPEIKKRNAFFVLAKLAVGIGLIAALILRVDLSALLESIASVDLLYLTLMLVIPHLMIGISTLKWQLFLRKLDLHLGFVRLFAIYLMGTFFNNFLPTMVGGDAIRIYALGQDAQDASSVMAATFLERLVGLAALVSLVPLVVLSRTVTDRFPAVWLVAAACLVGFGIATALILSSRMDFLWRRFRRIRLLRRTLNFLAKTRKAIYRAADSLGILVGTFLLSLVFYVCAAATVWAAVKSLGAEVSIGYLMATVPLVLVAGMLPVSLNGLGITEAGFALFLQLSGVPLVDAVAVGLLLRGRQFITALFGGLIFLRYRSTGGTTQTVNRQPAK